MATNVCVQNIATGKIFALNPHHLTRMVGKSTSDYPTENLVSIGLGHAARKSVKKLPGDKYVVWSQAEYKSGICKPTHKSDILEGPTDGIITGQRKVDIFRSIYLAEACSCIGGHDVFSQAQPRCWSDGTAGATVREDAYILSIYDSKEVALVTVEGDVLYVSRHHLVMDPKIAAFDVENKKARGVGNIANIEGETVGSESSKIGDKPPRRVTITTDLKTDHDDSFDAYIATADFSEANDASSDKPKKKQKKCEPKKKKKTKKYGGDKDFIATNPDLFDS